MHSTAVGSGGVPAFLVKLWKLVEDSNYDELICWNSNGSSFFIRDQPRFARELLPLYFKHSNMASFIRQLNMYGFRKVVSIESGGLRVDKDEMEFQHNCFVKGNANLLECIKRKVPAGKSLPQEEAKPQPDLVNKMLFDVKNLHGKQESLNSKLDSMKRENETLWREIAALRQQHMKQQQIIQKLIQFFIGFVQPNRGMGVAMKRKMPLMLDSSAHSESKCSRLSRTLSYDPGSSSGTSAQNADSSSSAAGSALGPVIHDITDVVDAENFLNTGSDVGLQLAGSEPLFGSEPIVNSPGPSSSMDRSDESQFPDAARESGAADPLELKTVAGASPGSPPKSSNLDDIFKEISTDYAVPQGPPAETEATNPSSGSNDKTLSKVDIVNHMDSNSLELDSILKDFMANMEHGIDPSNFMGLFSSDDIFPNKGLSDMGEFGKLPGGNEIVGNELTQFTGAFKLDDLDTNPFVTDDANGESEGLYLGQDSIYGQGDADQDAVGTPPPLATDLALTPDMDFLVEPPSLLAEDLAMSPDRRKDSSSKS